MYIEALEVEVADMFAVCVYVGMRRRVRRVRKNKRTIENNRKKRPFSFVFVVVWRRCM